MAGVYLVKILWKIIVNLNDKELVRTTYFLVHHGWLGMKRNGKG